MTPVTAIRETTLGDLGVDYLTARLASSVGTEHPLGGLLAEGSNLALHVLGTMEIGPDQVGCDLARHSSAAAKFTG